MNPLKIHRVKSRFTSEQLNGKALRQYQKECPLDCSLEVSDIQPDGSFVLWALGAWPDLNVPKGKRGQIHQWRKSLDQDTVDKIEEQKAFSLLFGCNFVVFEQSPLSRLTCLGKDQ